MNTKRMNGILVCLSILFLFISFNLHIENRNFKKSEGSQSYAIVRDTYSTLSQSYADKWEHRVHDENGKALLKAHISDLREHRYNFDFFGYKSGTYEVSSSLHLISELLWWLNEKGELSEEEIAKLDNEVQFLITLLGTIQGDLGSHSIKWYKEFHKKNSRTAQYIKEQYNEFNK